MKYATKVCKKFEKQYLFEMYVYTIFNIIFFYITVKNLRWKTSRQENAGPYSYSDNQWVGYDDPKSIKEKVMWGCKNTFLWLIKNLI